MESKGTAEEESQSTEADILRQSEDIPSPKIDERMVKSKGRSGIKQYIKNKPVKFGIKIWVMSESQSGYTVDFDIYTGDKENGRNGTKQPKEETMRWYREGEKLVVQWKDRRVVTIMTTIHNANGSDTVNRNVRLKYRS
ncbi:uncharacterized protein [Diadema setosum]|uniref:uncharacterized protein n=1 Tax=Diadema setosum TaxID=31175 RepID=UPI003B3A9674